MNALAKAYYKYLDETKENREHRANRLYVTDLGKCKRQVWYRLRGYDANAESSTTVINKAMMFNQAEHIESTLANALQHSGNLLAYQYPVPITDRDNWGGICDIIADPYGEPGLIEVKTTRSAAFRDIEGNFPKTEHELQVAVYDHYISEEGIFKVTWLPILWYADRGGSNTPLEYAVTYDWEPISIMMDELDDIRKTVNVAPDRMPKALVMRARNTRIMNEPAWHCSYCDYSDVCKPDMTPNLWGVKEDGMWRFTKKADLDVLRPFADKMVKEKVVWKNGTLEVF